MDGIKFLTKFYNYVYLPILFIIVVVSFYMLIRQKLTFKQFIKSVLFILIPTIVLYVYAFWLGTIYLYIGLIVFFSLRFSKAKTIGLITLIFIVAIIADHITALLSIHLHVGNIYINLIIQTVLFSAIHLLLIAILKLISKTVQVKVTLPFYAKGMIISLLVITLVTFYYNIFRAFNHFDILKIKLNFVVFLLFFFLLIVLVSMIYYILLKEKHFRLKELQNKFFHDYIVSLEETNKKMQQFQHDYLNILLSLKGYIDNANWNGLKAYFERDILHFERKTLLENKAFGHLKNINVMSLKGLLLIKSLRAIDKNLNITIEVAEPIDEVYVDFIDLNRILGNLIDNAIENCIEDGKQTIQIAIVKQENSLIFRVCNEIGERKINISQIFQKGYTTKSYGNGIGLYNVKMIVDKNTKMNLNVWIEKGWFNVELVVLGGK